MKTYPNDLTQGPCILYTLPSNLLPPTFKPKCSLKPMVKLRNSHIICSPLLHNMGFPGGSAVKNLPASAGDTSSIPGLGRSPGQGNGNLLQYSCMGNPIDRGAWRATVHGITKESDTTNGLNNNSIIYLCFTTKIVQMTTKGTYIPWRYTKLILWINVFHWVTIPPANQVPQFEELDLKQSLLLKKQSSHQSSGHTFGQPPFIFSCHQESLW